MQDRIQMALTSALIEVYGVQAGIQTAGVIAPGIVQDFRGMLKQLKPGARTQETYKLEDQRAVIVLMGYADAAGQPIIDGLTVNGKHCPLTH